MPKKSSTLSGFYRDQGIIQLENTPQEEVGHHMGGVLPSIPYGTRLEVTLVYDEVDYLHGSTGIVWATYHLRQAETIQAALLAQSIACELSEHSLPGARLYLLRIPEARDSPAAIDFIWREKSGMRLKPDWDYPVGADNQSFRKWIEGI